MIKRLALLFGVGLLLLFLITETSMNVFAGTKKYSEDTSLTITGVGSGDDSTVVDTYSIFTSNHYGNRAIVVVDFDSVTEHGTGSTIDSFALRDSIFVVLKGEYAGQYFTIDSTEDSLFDANNLTVTLAAGNLDSLHKFGEQLYVIVRIADTVGLTTSSAAVFNFRIRVKYFYHD